MENPQQQQKQESSNRSEFEKILVMYIDITFRGLLAFGITLIVILLLRGLWDISNIFIFVVAFLLSVLIAPFFSRFKIGHLIIDKYVNILNKMFRLEKKNG